MGDIPIADAEILVERWRSGSDYGGECRYGLQEAAKELAALIAQARGNPEAPG